MQPAGEADVVEASEVERKGGRPSRTGHKWPWAEVLFVKAPIGTV